MKLSIHGGMHPQPGGKTSMVSIIDIVDLIVGVLFVLPMLGLR